MAPLAPTEDIPEEAKSWLRAALGGYHILAVYRAGSTRTGVWRLSRDGEEIIFKLHYNKLNWHSEVYAYKACSVAYEPYLPTLIGIFEGDNMQGIAVTALSGKPLQECQFGDDVTARVYYDAGRLCRRLHDLPAGTEFGLRDQQGTPLDYDGNSLGDRATDPVAYIRDNFIKLLRLAQEMGGLEPAEQALADIALDSMEVFAGEAPTLVNADYTPNNWLVDQDGRLTGIIDLEHVTHNVFMDGFTRLLIANDQPGTEAFLAGYGSNPVAGKPMQAQILCMRHALLSIGYGIKLNNENWVKRGKRVLRRLDSLSALSH